MPAKRFFFTLACFVYGYSAQMSAQSTATHADNTPQTTTNAISALPTAGSDSFAKPLMLRYDGVVNRQPSSTAVAVVFSVYSSSDPMQPIWQEAQNVQPDQDGRYTAFLGASGSSALPSFVLAATEPRWLGVRVDGEGNEQKTLLTKAFFVSKASIGVVATGTKEIGSSNSQRLQQKSSAKQTALSGLVTGTAVPASLPTLPIDFGSVFPVPIVPHEIVAENTTEVFEVRQDGSGIGAHFIAQTNNALLAETTSASTAHNTILSMNRAPDGAGVRAESQASTGSGSGVWGV